MEIMMSDLAFICVKCALGIFGLVCFLLLVYYMRTSDYSSVYRLAVILLAVVLILFVITLLPGAIWFFHGLPKQMGP